MLISWLVPSLLFSCGIYISYSLPSRFIDSQRSLLHLTATPVNKQYIRAPHESWYKSIIHIKLGIFVVYRSLCRASGYLNNISWANNQILVYIYIYSPRLSNSTIILDLLTSKCSFLAENMIHITNFINWADKVRWSNTIEPRNFFDQSQTHILGKRPGKLKRIVNIP